MVNEHHQEAQRLSSQAALLHANGRCADASALYARAAWLEREALQRVPASQPKTRGALSVSLAYLLVKAEEYDAAEQEARAMLADGALPDFARRELQELLDDLATTCKVA